MNESNVTIYVSESNQTCEEVVNQLKRWNISFEVKNITKEPAYRKEMQKRGIYSTPATFVKGINKAILGFQKRKLQVALDIEKAKRTGQGSFLLSHQN